MSNDTDDMLGWLDDAMSPEIVASPPPAAVVGGNNRRHHKGPPSSAARYDPTGTGSMGHQQDAAPPSSAVAESRQAEETTLYTPQLRHGAASIRSQQHHIFPVMSPIVPRKSHRLENGSAEDDEDDGGEDGMMIASPMGQIDLSTPPIASMASTESASSGSEVAGTTDTDNNGASSNLFPPRLGASTPTGTGTDTGADEATTNEGEDPDETAPEESDEERRRREEEEQSIELARQLMAQEAMESYNMSTNFLRDNADQYSEEDLAALEAAMAEEAGGIDEEAEEGEEEAAELSYDAMLRLGEQIGDVKQERWAMVAQTHIDRLPTMIFEPSMAEGKEENHTEVKCQVCQCAYEAEEEMRRLPCGHCFHKDCVDQWLKSHDTCCFCKKSIIEQDE